MKLSIVSFEFIGCIFFKGCFYSFFTHPLFIFYWKSWCASQLFVQKTNQKRTLFTHFSLICFCVREYKVFRRNFYFAEPHLKLRVATFLISKILSEYSFRKEVFSFVLGIFLNPFLFTHPFFIVQLYSWCVSQFHWWIIRLSSG